MTIQNEKCRQLISKAPAYCDRVKMRVPAAFCNLVCQGKPELWSKQSIKEARIKRMANTPLKKVRRKKKLVTVFVPVIEADGRYLKRTLESLTTNAGGPIEIIVMADGWETQSLNGELVLNYPDRIGLRKGMNIAANKAKGEYFVKLDSHCALTPNWDLKLKDSCDANTFVAPAIDKLDEESWQGTSGDMSFVTLDGNLQMQFFRPYMVANEWPVESEIITTIACCFMMKTDYYRHLDGCDEELGAWGDLGAEWALKVWLTGGRCLLRSDVVCSHLFREMTPFTIDAIRKSNASKKLYRQWICGEDKRRTRTLSWLVGEKFSYMNNRDVPLFGLGGMGYSIRRKDWDFLREFMRENNIENILEIGAGKSTLMFDNLGCSVVSYETIPFIADTITSLSTDRVRIEKWDGKSPIETDDKLDLIFIDGPAGGDNREPSYKSVANMNTKFVACHDANRKWESLWAKKYLSGRECVAQMDDGRIKVYK